MILQKDGITLDKQGVHQKIRYDEEFPKPIAVINTRILVFTENDIITYEQKRKELTDVRHKRYLTHGRLNIFLNINC